MLKSEILPPGDKWWLKANVVSLIEVYVFNRLIKSDIKLKFWTVAFGKQTVSSDLSSKIKYRIQYNLSFINLM